jgi:hypothetical protein
VQPDFVEATNIGSHTPDMNRTFRIIACTFIALPIFALSACDEEGVYDSDLRMIAVLDEGRDTEGEPETEECVCPEEDPAPAEEPTGSEHGKGKGQGKSKGKNKE